MSCAFSSCHGGAAKAGLSLRTADAYSELVGQAAEGEFTKGRGLVRVVPGDPDGSLLLRKIDGPPAGEGDRMPDVEGEQLTDDQISAIRTWIARGAAND